MNSKKQLNIEFGARLQHTREQRGMTQEQLAEQVNRSTQFVSIVERGSAGVSLETIVSLCKALNTSADWLLLGLAPSENADFLSAKLSQFTPQQLVVLNRLIDDLRELTEA